MYQAYRELRRSQNKKKMDGKNCPVRYVWSLIAVFAWCIKRICYSVFIIFQNGTAEPKEKVIIVEDGDDLSKTNAKVAKAVEVGF